MTAKARNRGFNQWPTGQHLYASGLFNAGWIRWGPEWPWYQDTENDPFRVEEIVADVRSVLEADMSAQVDWMGVPSWVNPAANGTEQGGYHRFPIDGAGRLKRAAALDLLLDAIDALLLEMNLPKTRVRIEVDNESNLIADFNKDDQSPAVVAVSLADCIDIVLDHGYIAVFGGLTAYGSLLVTDPNDPEWIYHMDNWGQAMIDAEPRLITQAQTGRTRWGIHCYHFDGGSQSDWGNDPTDELGWNGFRHANAFWNMLQTNGLTAAQSKMQLNEYGEPSFGGAGFSEDWQNSHGRLNEDIINWWIALGMLDEVGVFRHNMRDDYDPVALALADPNDPLLGVPTAYQGALRNNFSKKALANSIIEYWSVDPDTTTEPPVDPTSEIVIAGPAIAVSPTQWGYRMGLSVDSVGAMDAAAVRALGMKHLRVEETEGAFDFDDLGAAVADAKARGVIVTLALKSNDDYNSWAWSRSNFYLAELLLAAQAGVRRIEILPHVNITETYAQNIYALGQLCQLARFYLHDYPKTKIVVGAMPTATVSIGNPPHVTLDSLFVDYGPELGRGGAAIDAVALDGNDQDSGPLFDSTDLPYKNPIWHLTDITNSMHDHGILTKIDITGLNYTGTDVAMASYFQTVMGELERRVREDGLPLGKVFWAGIQDLTDGANHAPFAFDGSTRAALVSAMTARAALTYPAR